MGVDIESPVTVSSIRVDGVIGDSRTAAKALSTLTGMKVSPDAMAPGFAVSSHEGNVASQNIGKNDNGIGVHR